MITMVFPLSAGNAVRVHTELADGAQYMRVLRRTDTNFAGPTDPGAVMVVDGLTSAYWVDAADDLINGVEVFYRAYDWNGSAWSDQGVSFAATPAMNFQPDTLDVQELVRDRIQLGITGAIAAGWLKPASGAIQVTTAPFSLADSTSFPTISVHMESTGPEVRDLGDELEGDIFVAPDTWLATEGWLARTALNVVGVSQNADERIQLRKVLRQIIQANLPVFSGVGMTLVEFQQTDAEQFSENNVPLYITNGTFSAVAPAFVRSPSGVINEVTLDPGALAYPDTEADYYGSNPI